MTERIKLTKENFNVINYYHSDKPAIKCSQEFMKQILDDHAKIEKITAYAKNLVYSNPHISWQLKQLLRDTPPKEKANQTKGDSSHG